jgi:GNAT superfamily N-acetyltransferase
MEASPSPIAIRQATVRDAELLSRFGAALFLQTFAHQNSPEDMAAYLASAFGPVIQAAELEQPGTTFFIASIGEAPAGYAQLAATEPVECAQGVAPVELVRLYVDAAWHGQGLSHRLLQEVLDRAADRGHDRIWLGVWEKNARAIAFYRKRGFEVVGRKDFLLGSDLQTDLVMVRGLEQVPRV